MKREPAEAALGTGNLSCNSPTKHPQPPVHSSNFKIPPLMIKLINCMGSTSPWKHTSLTFKLQKRPSTSVIYFLPHSSPIFYLLLKRGVADIEVTKYFKSSFQIPLRTSIPTASPSFVSSNWRARASSPATPHRLRTQVKLKRGQLGKERREKKKKLQQELFTITPMQYFTLDPVGGFPKDICLKSCNAEFTYSISCQLPHPEPKCRRGAKKIDFQAVLTAAALVVVLV